MRSISLMYHDLYEVDTYESGLEDENAQIYKVQINHFKDQVAFVSNYLDEHKLPKESVTFTFDDGGVSLLTLAAPVLEKFGFKGCFFVITNRIGQKGFLSVENIIDLHKRGHIVGSHSHNHPDNMTLLTKEEIRKEWESSVGNLKQILQKEISYASVPNGYLNKEVIEAVTACDIKTLFVSTPTTKEKSVSGVTRVGRYVILQDTTITDVERILSSTMYRWKLLLRWNILGALRYVMGTRYEALKNVILKLRHD